MLHAEDVELTKDEHETFINFIERQQALMKLQKTLGGELKAFWELIGVKYQIDLEAVSYVPDEHETKLIAVGVRLVSQTPNEKPTVPSN